MSSGSRTITIADGPGGKDMAEKIVVFGAGSTGRGHVGLLAWEAGYDIVFVDIDPRLVQALERSGKYTVRLYGGTTRDVTVSGYRVIHAGLREEVAEEVAGAALVLTAVFDNNLPDVARTLAMAVTRYRKSGRTSPLNCIACENMMNSSSVLGTHVQSLLDGEDAACCRANFGFPDCMISRVVPRPESDPLFIVAEDYNEWTVRKDAFKGPAPAALAALELVDNQTARLERKLFIHNGGHAICGYMGFHRGWTYIHEAVHDDVVAAHVLGALDELGEVVRRRHGFSAESISAYKRDLVRRGSVPEMRDAILRVVRDPIRKLSPKERLVAPAMLAGEYGLPREWIVRGIAACLRYRHEKDSQSMELAGMIQRTGLMPVLASVCSIEPHSPLARDIDAAWRNWNVKPYKDDHS